MYSTTYLWLCTKYSILDLVVSMHNNNYVQQNLNVSNDKTKLTDTLKAYTYLKHT